MPKKPSAQSSPTLALRLRAASESPADIALEVRDGDDEGQDDQEDERERQRDVAAAPGAGEGLGLVVGITHLEKLQGPNAGQVLGEQRGEQERQVEDREGEEVARVPRAGADVVEPVVVARIGRLARMAAEEPDRQQQEDQA